MAEFLGQASVNYEEFFTIICDIKAVINCRPLTCVSKNTEDFLPLTLSMFLRDFRTPGVVEIDIIGKNKLLIRQHNDKNVANDFELDFAENI